MDNRQEPFFEIIPSPGTEDKEWHLIEKKLELVRSFAKTVHIDVVDGKFAANTTWMDPSPFKKYTKDMLLEVHLMVDDPLQYVQAFAEAGFRRFIGQIERMPDQISFIAAAQRFGEVGLALDGKTPLEKLQVPLIDLDSVLLMTIDAGFSGQAFQEEQLSKVSSLREKDDLLSLSVDGGLNQKTILKAKEKGANRFIVTSGIFNDTATPEENFLALHALLSGE